MFGGNSGNLDQSRPQGYCRNDIQVLESSRTNAQDGPGPLEWSRPSVKGEKPSPLSDTEMFFSPVTGKITLFGGWSNRWHGDLYNCDVSNVVGPTYNIFCISSNGWDEPIGPITGGSKMFLIGKGFSSVQSSIATIKFACAKGIVEVPGQVLSDDRVSFTTPNFQKYGAVKVEVRLKIGSQSFTNNIVDFAFFVVTSGAETVAFGPGLIDENPINRSTSFIIQAKDKNGNNRVCRMDKFHVEIQLQSDTILDKSHLNSTAVDYELVDNHDGKYEVNYSPLVAGVYVIDVRFEGTFDGVGGYIRGSSASYSSQLFGCCSCGWQAYPESFVAICR